MLKLIRAVLKKMSSNEEKKTLAQKLIKSGRIVKERNNTNPGGGAVPDIEDAAEALCAPNKSQYFSPVQTRHQRKVILNPPKKLLLNERKPRVRKDVRVELVEKIKPLTTETLKETKIGITTSERKKQLKKKEVKQELNLAMNASATSANNTKHPNSNWKPPHWLQMLQNIRKMREVSLAPVDFMGCDKCADNEADEKTQRFHKLVGLMLSSQTKDETTYGAIQRLKLHTLTPSSIVQMQPTDLENILNPVSFYKNKAKYLQQTSRILIDQYAQDIPNNVKDLIALPGVGPKMAHICMATAWNEITGIGVDVHVHRITNRMGWLPSETKEPERTRIVLEQWLPRQLWAEINHLLVGFGQTICTPLQPKCGNCLNSSICPAAFKSSPSKATKIKSVVTKNKNTEGEAARCLKKRIKET